MQMPQRACANGRDFNCCLSENGQFPLPTLAIDRKNIK